MKMTTVLLFGAAAAVPAAAQTAPPSPPAATTPAIDPHREQLGLELAQLLNTREDVIKQMTGATYAAALKQRLLGVPDFAKLESEHPGLSDFVIARVQPVLADGMSNQLPDLWQRLGKVYSRRLNEGELTQALAFFRSPLGLKTRASINGQLAAASAGPVGRGDEFTQNNVLKVLGDAGVRAMGNFTPAERAELMRVSQSPMGIKMQAANVEGAGVMADWGKEPHPDLQQAVNAAMTSAVTEFLQ
ncbi:MAG: DUF2059 domain-containing protein [Sphingomonas sp.]|uniref:DUF2059 domain-containing protein n=1 Tax=Sphingomonas sp. TaxID=28214 RepID=UPI003F7FC84B